MNRRYLPILFAATLIIGGCNEMNANFNSKASEEQPVSKALALQDEFTKEFITSQEEVEEGYYKFESGTRGFSMLFPVNATLDEVFYQKRNQDYESIYFGEDRKEGNTGYSVKITYENEESTEWIDSYLNVLIGSSNLQREDFKETTMNENTIYFAEENLPLDENKSAYVFLSYIKSNDSHQAVSIEYSAVCMNESKACILDQNEEREYAKKLIHSITFNR